MASTNDGGPSMQNDLGLQFNQGSSSLGAKVQEMVLALQGPKSDLPGLETIHKPDFVHVVS